MKMNIKSFSQWLSESSEDKDTPLKYNENMDLSQKVEVVWEDILQNGDKNSEWFDEAWDLYEMSDKGKEVYKILDSLIFKPNKEVMESLNTMYVYDLIPGYKVGKDQQLTNVFWELAEIFNVQGELRDLNKFSPETIIDELSDTAKDFIINYDSCFGIPNHWQPMEPYKRAAEHLTTGNL